MVQGRSDEVLKWLSVRSIADSAGWALPKNIAEACGISEDDAKKAVHRFLAKKVGEEAPEITPHQIAGHVKSFFVRFGKNEDTAELAIAGSWINECLKLSGIPELSQEQKEQAGFIKPAVERTVTTKAGWQAKVPGNDKPNQPERKHADKRNTKKTTTNVAKLEKASETFKQSEPENVEGEFHSLVISQLKKSFLKPEEKENHDRIIYWTAVDIVCRRKALIGEFPPESSAELVEEVVSIREGYSEANCPSHIKDIFIERVAKVAKAMNLMLFEAISELKDKNPDCTAQECAKLLEKKIHFVQNGNKLELSFNSELRKEAWSRSVVIHAESRFNNLA